MDYMQGGMGGGMAPQEGPTPPGAADDDDSISLLRKALELVRQATDSEDDPQMKLAIEKVSTLIQQAISQDHAAGYKALGMNPQMARVLTKAG